MTTSKIQTGLRLVEYDYDRLKWIAQAEGRTLNNLAEYIIHRYLDEYEAQKGPIPCLDE